MEGMIVSKSELISERSRNRFDVFMKGVTVGMHKAQRQVMKEIVWGILQSGTVRLSEIGRWIGGVGTKLLSRIKRMSRQLGDEWDNGPLRENHLRGIGRMVGRGTSVVMDISDIRKDRGKKFEYLSRVYDGSTGETALGYNMLSITAVLGKGRQMPLYLAPFSAAAPRYESENKEIIRGVDTVVKTTGGNGVWIADRGFDNKWLFNELAERHLRFMVCGFRERQVRVGGEEREVHHVVEGLELNGTMYVGRRGKKKRPLTIRYGSCPVAIPEWWDGTRHRGVYQELWLLVVEGYGEEGHRSFFYTNVALDSDAIIREMVRRYSDRWAIEEGFEFLKQRLQLEDVRVRHWRAIERICLCAMLAFAFLVLFVEYVCAKSKRLFPVLCKTQCELDPDAKFIYYRVLDAIQIATSFVLALNLWLDSR